jgi:hypothetical protein
MRETGEPSLGEYYQEVASFSLSLCQSTLLDNTSPVATAT